MHLLLIASAALAGDITLTVQVEDKTATVHLEDVASCAHQEITLDDGEGGTWDLSFVAAALADEEVWLSADVAHKRPIRRKSKRVEVVKMRPSFMARDGQTAELTIGDDHSVQMVAVDLDDRNLSCLPHELAWATRDSRDD